jgi:hypothetical protein
VPAGGGADNAMQRFYAGVIAGLVGRAAVLYEVGFAGGR